MYISVQFEDPQYLIDMFRNKSEIFVEEKSDHNELWTFLVDAIPKYFYAYLDHADLERIEQKEGRITRASVEFLREK